MVLLLLLGMPHGPQGSSLGAKYSSIQLLIGWRSSGFGFVEVAGQLDLHL